MSVADEVSKLKTLLDEGTITQEEFDAQKKIIMGVDPLPMQAPQQTPVKKKRKGNVIGLIVFLGVVIFVLVKVILNFADSQGADEAEVVFDALRFYTSNSTTVTEEELIEILGQPDETEEWNYDTGTKSYPIKTLYYEGYTYSYHFNAGMLQRISIDDVNIPYTSKDQILPMFGLKRYSNTVVEADTNFAYRITNCGVRQFWVAEMDGEALRYIRIDYGSVFG